MPVNEALEVNFPTEYPSNTGNSLNPMFKVYGFIT